MRLKLACKLYGSTVRGAALSSVCLCGGGSFRCLPKVCPPPGGLLDGAHATTQTWTDSQNGRCQGEQSIAVQACCLVVAPSQGDQA